MCDEGKWGRTGTRSGMSLGGGSLAIEGVVLHLEAAVGFGGVAPPQAAARATVPSRGPLEGAEESALRKHCAGLRWLSGDARIEG